MRWSKLRQLVMERFASNLQGRLDIRSTSYGHTNHGSYKYGHCWITWDGEVIANFCVRAHSRAEILSEIASDEGDKAPSFDYPKWNKQSADYGEFTRQDAHFACWAFVHDLDINEALADEDPLVNFLAIADSRLGRRRLETIDPETLHPLAARILKLRLSTKTKV